MRTANGVPVNRNRSRFPKWGRSAHNQRLYLRANGALLAMKGALLRRPERILLTPRCLPKGHGYKRRISRLAQKHSSPLPQQKMKRVEYLIRWDAGMY